MLLARVNSRVVSTAKFATLPDRPMLQVTLLPEFVGSAGDELIVLDTVQAGPGDLVLILQEGTGARQVLGLDEFPLPLHSVVVGVVDQIV